MTCIPGTPTIVDILLRKQLRGLAPDAVHTRTVHMLLTTTCRDSADGRKRRCVVADESDIIRGTQRFRHLENRRLQLEQDRSDNMKI